MEKFKNAFKEPQFPLAVIEDKKITNAEELLGEWEACSPEDGNPRQRRRGWCFIPQECEMTILDPDSFCAMFVWGTVEILQGRTLRNEHYEYTPVVIGTSHLRLAHTRHEMHGMGTTANVAEFH